MTITQDNYLDFSNLIINELFGNVALFIIVGLAIITYYGAKNSLPIQVQFLNCLLFIALTVSFVYNQFVWMVALFVIGIIVYASLPKILSRG